MTQSSAIQSVAVFIPVRNGGEFAIRQILALQAQRLPLSKIMVFDSQSVDGSPDLYRKAGFDVRAIGAHTFDHGGTRNLGWQACDTDLVVFLTQDSIPLGKDCLRRLCEPFADPQVGIVTGRQVAREQSSAIDRHARSFNYPQQDNRRSWPEASKLGFRALFNSNAFAAYRTSMLRQINGFPEGVIVGEDHGAAARALRNGWVVAYCANAVAEHSHGYTIKQEFKRYFDIGVSHTQNRFLFADFDGPVGEGKKFVVSEISYLAREAPFRIPEACVRSVVKFAAYKLGRHEASLPPKVKRRMSMHARFFSHVPSPAGMNKV